MVLVYAFDCTITPSLPWDKMEQEIFWLVQEKLTHFKDSCLGYTYVMSTPNTYTHDVKLVDSKETKTAGYSGSSAWRKNPCTKNMASGLPVAHKLMRDHGCSSPTGWLTRVTSLMELRTSSPRCRCTRLLSQEVHITM